MCPECGVAGAWHPTYTEAWVLLEPAQILPAYIVPPRQRWLIDGNDIAWNTGDDEPAPGAPRRIAHRLVCPGLERQDLWPWLTALELENARRAQRQADQGTLPQLPDTG
ncbi:DUF6083 domain-containing protein [Streptomyces sp. NPDC058614]|uniref:DUF6083 domain-containing protein n=1 Tax=Streptomyces sp. NPDC058614 TaxID=3346557 RepID=UPI00364EA3D0